MTARCAPSIDKCSWGPHRWETGRRLALCFGLRRAGPCVLTWSMTVEKDTSKGGIIEPDQDESKRSAHGRHRLIFSLIHSPLLPLLFLLWQRSSPWTTCVPGHIRLQYMGGYIRCSLPLLWAVMTHVGLCKDWFRKQYNDPLEGPRFNICSFTNVVCSTIERSDKLKYNIKLWFGWEEGSGRARICACVGTNCSWQTVL